MYSSCTSRGVYTSKHLPFWRVTKLHKEEKLRGQEEKSPQKILPYDVWGQAEAVVDFPRMATLLHLTFFKRELPHFLLEDSHPTAPPQNLDMPLQENL